MADTMITSKWPGLHSDRTIFPANRTSAPDTPEKPLWMGQPKISEDGFLDFLFGLRATGMLRLTRTTLLFQSAPFGIKIPLREIRYAAQAERTIHIRTIGSVFYRGQGHYMLDPLADSENLYRQIMRLCFGGWHG